jgi:hypothetical protein
MSYFDESKRLLQVPQWANYCTIWRRQNLVEVILLDGDAQFGCGAVVVFVNPF